MPLHPLPNDAACLLAIRALLSYLPSNNLEEPPLGQSERSTRIGKLPSSTPLVPGRSQPALRHQAA